jgi:hypothetical protein
MKTAMQELLSEMSHPNWDKLSFDARYQMFDMLLELEKEQIKMANMDGYKEGCTYHSFDHRPKTTEEYYNQTYNQNK